MKNQHPISGFMPKAMITQKTEWMQYPCQCLKNMAEKPKTLKPEVTYFWRGNTSKNWSLSKPQSLFKNVLPQPAKRVLWKFFFNAYSDTQILHLIFKRKKAILNIVILIVIHCTFHPQKINFLFFELNF